MSSIDERDSRVVDAYHDGMSVPEVAHAFNLTRQRIYQILSEHDVKLRPRARVVKKPEPVEMPSVQQQRKVLMLRAKGESIPAILWQTRLNRAQVEYVLKYADSDLIAEVLGDVGD